MDAAPAAGETGDRHEKIVSDSPFSIRHNYFRDNTRFGAGPERGTGTVFHARFAYHVGGKLFHPGAADGASG